MQTPFKDLAEAERRRIFKEAVDRHDLTYEYSDDHSVWRRGSTELTNIKSMAQDLDPEFVRETWNAKCDRALIPSEAPRWYWKG